MSRSGIEDALDSVKVGSLGNAAFSSHNLAVARGTSDTSRQEHKMDISALSILQMRKQQSRMMGRGQSVSEECAED